MALEDLLAENTAAVKALTAAMVAGGAKPAAATGTGRPPGRPKSVTLDEVKAIAERVKVEKGRPDAVALIKQFGAASLAELDKAKYPAFIAACEVTLNAEDEPAATEDEEVEL